MVTEPRWGRRASDHQKVRTFVDRWGVYLAIFGVLVVTFVGFVRLEAIVREQRQDRIAQCEAGNMLRQHLHDLAVDLGADRTSLTFVDKEFPPTNCEHPVRP